MHGMGLASLFRQNLGPYSVPLERPAALMLSVVPASPTHFVKIHPQPPLSTPSRILGNVCNHLFVRAFSPWRGRVELAGRETGTSAPRMH